MAARPIIIDCDPGQDDALALLMALASPEDLDVLGVTAVAGNVPLAKTQRNARIIVEIAGRHDVPVFAGCPRPFLRELVTGERYHGNEGINGIELFEPSVPLQDKHAVDFLIDTLLAADDGAITLVPVGPLTNVGLALIKQPRIASKIRELVIMGGAWREGGNRTPSAEFNILADPHAAKVVFRCGRPITVCSLDVTHRAVTTPERLSQVGAIKSRVGRAAHCMLGFYHRDQPEKYYGQSGAPLHDALTIAWLLQPALFQGKTVNVEVDVASELSMGCTVVDFWGVTERPKNANWLHTVDADGFYALLLDRLRRYPDDARG